MMGAIGHDFVANSMHAMLVELYKSGLVSSIAICSPRILGPITGIARREHKSKGVGWDC